MGSKYLDANHMSSTKFLGVYREKPRLRAYQFYFEVDGEIVQELLPFSGPCGFPGKNTWVLSPEEFQAFRVAARRAPAPGGDVAWEQHDDQAGDDDQQWGGQGWDDFGQDHQYQQYQQPPPPQKPYMKQQSGYDYIPREEYDTLVGRIGDVESMLQDVNTNVMSLTQSFSEFTTHFLAYYSPPHGGAGGQ
jgi:hypothetical protein